MSRRYLRDDVAIGLPFTVSELPCQAKLDQNEAPYDLPGEVKELLTAKLADLAWNRYPQPAMYHEIKAAFGKAIGFRPENIFLGMGCDQLIQGAYFVAGGKGKRALVFEPTYPMFAHAARFTQTETTRVQLAPAERLGLGHIAAANQDLIFIVAPNNPTGTMPEPGVVEAALKKSALVFVDEAYYDFSKTTWSHLLKQHPNLFIARSLSKSCLAGIRLGYGLGHEEVIRAMESTFTAPYHLSFLQLVIARHFDLIMPHLAGLSAQIIAERQRLSQELERLGLSYVPSHGNFILFAVKEPARVFQRLAEAGVRIRSLHTIPGLSEYVRVTVGNPKDNDLFLKQLRQVLA
jgi:histidinol-phosphate aminotransferase